MPSIGQENSKRNKCTNLFTLNLNEDEEETGCKKKKKVQIEEEALEKEEHYTKDELPEWVGEGPGKGQQALRTEGRQMRPSRPLSIIADLRAQIQSASGKGRRPERQRGRPNPSAGPSLGEP